MFQRTIVCAGAAAAVLLLSGAAFPGGVTTSINELVEFNESTGELWAYPKGQPMAIYRHTRDTRHLLADLSRFTPPDPCFPLAVAWNRTVRYDERHHVQSTFLFEAILSLQSRFQCNATVTSTDIATSSPPPIVQILPTAQ
jgi:hypothetical protein